MRIFRSLPVAVLAFLSASASFAAAGGVYKIPAGEFLEADVFLRSSNVKWIEDAGLINLKYRLPKEIDGADPRWIDLKSVSLTDPLTLTGPEGIANCTKVVNDIECTIYYKKNDQNIYPIDIEAAKAYVASRSYSPEKTLLMEKAQQSIMHEAAGVLSAHIRD
jgi:hypothetical protein